MKKFIEIIQKKWLKDTTKTIILILILFTAFIGINLIIQKLDLKDIDITKNKLFTLSETSKNQIQKVNEEVKMYLVGFEENTAMVDLIKQYQTENEKINYEIITDIQKRPDLKNKYQITDEAQLLIIEAGDKSKIVTTDELYTYDYTTYEQIDVSEEKITNAIANLVINEKPKIYFLTGHEEYGIDSNMTILKAYLQNELNDIQTLDLLVKKEIPEDTSLLVISNPQKDLLDNEVEIITNYINKGGKIFWMNDPKFKNTNYPNIEKILNLFGVKFEEGIILEQDENKIALQSPNYILPEIASTKATKHIATDGGILLINACKITIQEDKLEELGVNKEVILQTGETALFRKEVSNTNTSKIASDEEGQFTLGAKLTKTIEDKEAVMYVLANNFLTVDYPITIGANQMYPIQFYNNKDYILNTIAELTDRGDLISIRKDTGVVTYTATKSQDRNIKIAITIIPALIILIGITVWIIRRRKR